jgi:hypothetical protein
VSWSVAGAESRLCQRTQHAQFPTLNRASKAGLAEVQSAGKNSYL